jgi:hypothetical protein
MMLIKVKAYDECDDTFTVETEDARRYEVNSENIQLSDHENAEEPVDMIDREIVASPELEKLIEVLKYANVDYI